MTRVALSFGRLREGYEAWQYLRTYEPNGTYGASATWTFCPTLTSWSGAPDVHADCPDPQVLSRANAAVRRLWLAFLLLAAQFAVMTVAAIWGWLR